MVYLAGDNTLSSAMQKNINDMMVAWKKSYNANIVIYFDGRGSTPELYTFQFKGKEVEKQVLKTYEEMDSADPEVLKEVLNEMQELYPSDSYGLILGSLLILGVVGICIRNPDLLGVLVMMVVI